jgi:hypothetical protein
MVPGPAANAQGFGPDPFKPYNSRFDPFVYPVAPGPLDYGNNQGYTGSDRRGLRGANQFENYLNSLRNGTGNARTGGGPGAGAGTPYYRADRSIDRETEKLYQYRPNRVADEKFEANQEEVSKLYFRYLREKDPRKRAEVFREYSKAKNLAGRDLSAAPGSRTREAAARSNRRESAAPKPLQSTPSSARSSNPPPADTRSSSSRRSRAGGASSTPAAGSAPSPLDDLGTSLDTPKGAAPSRVLERALRTDPLGRGPRPRSPAPSSVGPAPPP